MMLKRKRSHCRLVEMVTNLATALPAIIRGMPPHWVKKPHQEQTPAMKTMMVAGSFLPPSHQGLLLPRSLVLTSSLFREFGGSSFPADSIRPFFFFFSQLVHLLQHLHLHHLLPAWVLACRCRLPGPFSLSEGLAVCALLLS